MQTQRQNLHWDITAEWNLKKLTEKNHFGRQHASFPPAKMETGIHAVFGKRERMLLSLSM